MLWKSKLKKRMVAGCTLQLLSYHSTHYPATVVVSLYTLPCNCCRVTLHITLQLSSCHSTHYPATVVVSLYTLPCNCCCVTLHIALQLLSCHSTHYPATVVVSLYALTESETISIELNSHSIL